MIISHLVIYRLLISLIYKRELLLLLLRRHIGPNVILWFVTRRQILFLLGGGRLRMHQQHSKTIGSVIGLSKIFSIKIYVRIMYDINHKTLRYSISNHME